SMLDAFVRAEGEPESVQLSGGEPSIHPQILEMLGAARERGIQLVMLNTNGIRLARDPRFATALAEIGVHVYLQFDGFSEATQLAMRGKSLTEEKLRALERCAESGVSVSLAAAVERDINEHEVGEIVRHGIEHPAVTGVFFQPVTHSGRFRSDSDPLEKLTNSDVIDAICEQLPEWFRTDDFVPVPCCSPTCRSATFALYDGEDLVPLPRLVDVEQYLDYVTNRAVPELDVREALEGLWSAKAAGGSEPVAERLECIACATAMPAELREVAARGFMIVVQDFQDPYTLDIEKLRKCCVSEITPDGRLIPFCAYNSVGYREQIRLQMSRQAASRASV
ncbi:MAG: radical SAM protein, partial [Actinomycetota bacterium]|nr:radical SAM protein [Actinomycetota bacterium]